MNTPETQRQDDEENDTKHNKSRYDYLIDARNHHYVQYHVWMLFFITINGGLFITYANLLKDGDAGRFEKITILLLGYVAAFLFFCSSKGYHYWITNFATLIHHYEREKYKTSDKFVYFVIANKENCDEYITYLNPLKGANISTTKMISMFAAVLTYGWGMLLTKYIPQCIYCFIDLPRWFLSLIVNFVATSVINFILISIACVCLKSNTKWHASINIEFQK